MDLRCIRRTASKWNIADATPYKKDLLGPLVSAAKAEGLKIGFYYSQSQDWNNPGGAKSGFKESEGWDDAHKGDYDAYLKNVAVPQTSRDLLTRYPIDILVVGHADAHDAAARRPARRAGEAAPRVSITNNRLGSGFGGDTATPEQFVPVTGYPGDWETCMTLNGHWGYNAYDQNWKSSTDLIRKLADICAKGGNFLLNVGPTAEGEFPPACASSDCTTSVAMVARERRRDLRHEPQGRSRILLVGRRDAQRRHALSACV
jgi:alpha-L-fucosidase